MRAMEIADFLHAELHGGDVEVEKTSTLDGIEAHSVIFAKKYSEALAEKINLGPSDVLAIVVPEYEGKIRCSYVISNNPRLSFIRVVTEFFTDRPAAIISPSAHVSPDVKIGESVSIGAGCVIEGDVTIGDSTILYPNVTITGKVKIGCCCVIKSGAVIGQSGFGYERDENGVPVAFPHTGGVRIGDNVSIGANTCIDRATIRDTIVEDNVKIDNLVHIAHNCIISTNTMIASESNMCGGVVIGQQCWISPHSSVLQHTEIGNNSTIGMGAVVMKKRVAANSVMFGNPAKTIGNNIN